MALLIVLALLVIVAAVSILGWTPDSRDTQYSVGRMLDWKPEPRHRGG
jgi:uncharacterized membrane protein